MFRVGHGYDIHKLQLGTGFFLGGLWIDAQQEIIAHSDGDILIHALIDSLLGAAGLGDIGQHFPDTDSQYKGISSVTLLTDVLDKLRADQWVINNTDITLVLEKPKLRPIMQSIKDNLVGILGCEPAQVNIKATTNEGLGYIGRSEAISCHAVSSITKV